MRPIIDLISVFISVCPPAGHRPLTAIYPFRGSDSRPMFRVSAIYVRMWRILSVIHKTHLTPDERRLSVMPHSLLNAYADPTLLPAGDIVRQLGCL